MTPGELNEIRKIVSSFQKQLHELRCAEEAMLRVMTEALPHVSPEVRAALLKYHQHKKDFSQEVLLEHEKRFPRQAAELDADSPLFPPDESSP